MKRAKPYSNYRNCISNECLENSIGWKTRKLSALPIPMDISREMLMLLLSIFLYLSYYVVYLAA